MTRAAKNRLYLVILEIIIVIIGIIYIYPVFLMFMNSVKPFREVVTDVIALPSKIEWKNYSYVIDKMNYWSLFLNNVIITVIGIAGIVFFAVRSL